MRSAALLLALAASAAWTVPAAGPGAGTGYAVSDEPVERLLPLMKAALEGNRKDLRGSTGLVRGFGAGTAYPQIWIRDSATLIPLTRYLYSRAHLSSWIEEHLAHQRADGSLHDWVAAGEVERFRADAPLAREVHRAPGVVLSADRNTSESDQETSAVIASAAVFAITGDRPWLARRVAGRRLIDRLDAALEYVRVHRLDPERGLVTAAFTADWGDVTPAHGDQRAIYRDEQTPVVASLYASALYVEAARRLAGLHLVTEQAARARRWEDEARRGAEAIEARLWQPAHGFYRMHEVLSWPGGGAPPDDAHRFGMGGNAVALLAGLGDAGRVGRVMAVARERRRRYGLSTLSGVLLPPYPDGFFRHPILRREFTYQNGGQWDWFGGRLLLAAFEGGQAEAAARELGVIAAQAVRNQGLFEWSTRAGEGQGSGRYAGSAGALGAAVLRGLYGIDLRHDGLDLRVRLGGRSGRVRVEEPATGATVAYQYACAPDARRVTLTYEAGRAGRGRLEVLLPPGRTAARGRLDGGPSRELEVRRVGDDRYAGLPTDWAPHRLELSLR